MFFLIAFSRALNERQNTIEYLPQLYYSGLFSIVKDTAADASRGLGTQKRI